MPESSSFGEVLYRLRQSRRRTQLDLVRSCGLSRVYYSQLENSRRRAPPVATVNAIATALALSEVEANDLHEAAAAERRDLVKLPSDVAPRIVRLVHNLAQRSHSMSELTLIRLEKILMEEGAM
jgi:transcriptional regulator with XRE-family HTH domain